MIKTIGLVVNPDKPEAFALAQELEREASSLSMAVVAESPCPASLNCRSLPLSELADESDVVLVLGGDGSLLRVARKAAPRGKLIVGIHFGKYGFITEIKPGEAILALRDIVDGDFSVSERLMLHAELLRQGEVAGDHFALNDIVVARGHLSRLVRLRVNVGPREVVRYSADGIVIATPTGSTAYSLSAGGPVVHPDIDAMILTPIAPHTLNSRALVIPADEPIRVTAESGAVDGVVTVDGQRMETLQDGDVVRISKASFGAKLVQIRSSAFYEHLESRLGFGDRYDR